MKDFPTKANESAGDDSGTALSFGAHEFNSIADENMNAVTSTGQTLTSGTSADTSTDTLARALTIAGQSASVYVDSGAANAYVLSDINSLTQPTAYYDGMRTIFKPANANTGNSVVNIESLGSKKILTIADAEIGSNAITTSLFSELIYDSTLDSGTGAFALNPLSTAITTNVIDSQALFNAAFIGTTLENQTIYLKIDGSPYDLTAPVAYSSNLVIDADPGVVIKRGGGNYNFVSQGTSGNEITNVYFTENWMFDGQGGIDSGLGGSTKFTGSGGFNNIKYTYNCRFHCECRNSYSSGSGGGYYDEDGLSYGNDIKNVSYCKSDVSGGGIFGVSSNITITNDYLKTKIKNVNNCFAVGAGGSPPWSGGGGISSSKYCDISMVYKNEATLGGGGGVHNCIHSTISNIYNNTTGGAGGGVVYCTNSTITTVYGNSASSGSGGVGYSDNSVISNVYINTSENTGGGVGVCDNSTITNVYSNDSNNNTAGGVYLCDNSTITNIHDNTSGTALGGGLSHCDNSTISNVYNNTGTGGGGLYLCEYGTISSVYGNNSTNSDGGGLYDCNYCTITDVKNNDAGTASGGGAASCDYSMFFGNFTGNTATTANNFIHNCASSMAMCFEGVGTGNYLSATTTRITINWNA